MLLRHQGFRSLCQARDRLREWSDPPVSIAELARDVRISPFHFMRQFEAVFGATPHQYRIQARLELAKQLRQPDSAVSSGLKPAGADDPAALAAVQALRGTACRVSV